MSTVKLACGSVQVWEGESGTLHGTMGCCGEVTIPAVTPGELENLVPCLKGINKCIFAYLSSGFARCFGTAETYSSLLNKYIEKNNLNSIPVGHGVEIGWYREEETGDQSFTVSYRADLCMRTSEMETTLSRIEENLWALAVGAGVHGITIYFDGAKQVVDVSPDRIPSARFWSDSVNLDEVTEELWQGRRKLALEWSAA